MIPWTAFRQTLLSITNSWSLVKLMSIKLTISYSVVPFSLSTSSGRTLCSSSSRLLPPLQNFLNHHCTVYSLAVPRWHPTPVLLPRKSHGRRSLVGCSPWGREESDTTKRLHFHFSLSCVGEGNGNPLQCSCLENPRDGEAWWAAVYGVAQSRTRMK